MGMLYQLEGEDKMLTTYDRYMREFKLKRLAEQLKRDDERDEREVVSSAHVALALRQATKQSMRHMEGHA